MKNDIVDKKTLVEDLTDDEKELLEIFEVVDFLRFIRSHQGGDKSILIGLLAARYDTSEDIVKKAFDQKMVDLVDYLWVQDNKKVFLTGQGWRLLIAYDTLIATWSD